MKKTLLPALLLALSVASCSKTPAAPAGGGGEEQGSTAAKIAQALQNTKEASSYTAHILNNLDELEFDLKQQLTAFEYQDEEEHFYAIAYADVDYGRVYKQFGGWIAQQYPKSEINEMVYGGLNQQITSLFRNVNFEKEFSINEHSFTYVDTWFEVHGTLDDSDTYITWAEVGQYEDEEFIKAIEVRLSNIGNTIVNIPSSIYYPQVLPFADFREMSRRCLAEGIVKKGTFNVKFTGYDLNPETGMQTDKYAEDEFTYIMDGNGTRLYCRVKGSSYEYIANLVTNRVWQRVVGSENYTLMDGVTAENIQMFSTTIGYALYGASNDLVVAPRMGLYYSMNEGSATYIMHNDLNMVYSVSYETLNGVNTIKNYTRQFDYSEDNRQVYEVTIDSYDGSVPDLN